MPKFLIRRTETTYRDLVIEAPDADAALEFGETLSYEAFHDQQDLSSDTTNEGEADADDIANLPNLTAHEDGDDCDGKDCDGLHI